MRSLPSVDQLSITCTSTPCPIRCASVHGKISASLKTHMNAVAVNRLSEFPNVRPLRGSPFVRENLQVGLVVPRRQRSSTERASEGGVIDETAVEDPDFQTGLSNAQTIIVVVTAVPGESFIEQAHRVNRPSRNQDTDETDHAGLFAQAVVLRPLSAVSD